MGRPLKGRGSQKTRWISKSLKNLMVKGSGRQQPAGALFYFQEGVSLQTKQMDIKNRRFEDVETNRERD
jgi:hypothetical protein